MARINNESFQLDSVKFVLERLHIETKRKVKNNAKDSWGKGENKDLMNQVESEVV